MIFAKSKKQASGSAFWPPKQSSNATIHHFESWLFFFHWCLSDNSHKTRYEIHAQRSSGLAGTRPSRNLQDLESGVVISKAISKACILSISGGLQSPFQYLFESMIARADQAADALPQCAGTSSNMKIMHRLQSFLANVSDPSAGTSFPLYQILIYGTCDHLRYVGPFSPQLVASATWDLCRHSWSPLLHETFSCFSYIGLVVASAT